MPDTATLNNAIASTLVIGEGTIDPAVRSQAGAISDQKVAEVADRLKTDEFYDEIDPAAVPTKCVDGRGRTDGQQQLGTNAAAGTFSLVIADALTTNSYRDAGQNAYEHAKRLYGQLIALGQTVGGHDDDHAQAPNCGCGAEDKLDSSAAGQPSILEYLVRRGSDIRTVLHDVGVAVEDDLHDKLVQNAGQLRSEHYASAGADLRRAFVETAGDTSIEHLQGVHNEVAVVINTKPGTTLNRLKLKAAFGDDYQAFNLDVAGLRATCELISISAQEAHEKFVAALYYNVATAAVLAGASLRVVVR